MNIAAIVMASGFSRRMGRNKMLCELNGRAVVEYVLDAVIQCGFYKNIVVTRFKEIDKFAKDRNMTVVYNENPLAGQSMSLKLGVQNSLNAEAYVFFLADQPFVRPSTVVEMMNIFVKKPEYIVLPRFENKTGLPVFFPASLRAELLELSGDNGARSVIRKYPEKIISFDLNDEMDVFDIDDENDLIVASNYLKIKK